MAERDGGGYLIGAVILVSLGIGITVGGVLLTATERPWSPVNPPDVQAVAAPVSSRAPAVARPAPLLAAPEKARRPTLGVKVASSSPADAGGEPGDAGVAQGGATLNGYVHDKFRRPIAGARVRISVSTASSFNDLANLRTDDDGRFQRAGLASAKVVLEVGARGYQTRVLSGVQLSEEEPSAVEILLKEGKPLSGRVVDDTGDPVAGAHVTVVAPPGAEYGDHVATSDPEGRFSFRELGPGRHCVNARKHPYSDAEQCKVSPGSTVTLRLLRPGAIAGRVVRALGLTPLTAFTVGLRKLKGDDLGGPTKKIRAPNGEFRIGELEPGEYSVSVSAAGRYYAERSPVSIRPGETTSGLVFELQGGGRVTGRVLSLVGDRPIPGAKVELLLGGRYARRSFRKTDELGRFEFEGVSPGSHSVNVERAGYREILLHRLTAAQVRGNPVVLRMKPLR